MIERQNDWADQPEELTPAMSEILTKKNMVWCHSMVGSKSIPFSRHDYFKLKGIDKDTYKRKVPA